MCPAIAATLDIASLPAQVIKKADRKARREEMREHTKIIPKFSHLLFLLVTFMLILRLL